MAGDEFSLSGLIFGRHLRGIAAGALALDTLHILDENGLCAQRHDLFLGRSAHIGGRDLRAQPPRGCNRLQARDADPHDEHARRRDGACGGHHHRESAAIFGRCVQHRLVTGKIRLARQDIHRLRAGDARHEFHRQCFESGGGIGIDPCALRKRAEARDDPRTRGSSRNARRIGALNAEQNVGARHRRRAVANRRACIAELRIADRGQRPCARLHRNARAQCDEFLDRLRRCRDAALTSVLFFQDRDFHAALTA